MEQEPQAQTPAADGTDAAPARKKGGLAGKLVVAVVVLAAIGGGAWWFLGAGATAEAEPAEPPLASRGLVTFEPFLVNLADAGGNRFLKLTAQLVVADQEQAAHIQDSQVVLMQLRSEVLELLTQQAAADLVTAEGKAALKDAIKTRVSAHLEHQQVIDVLFSEFVVQF